MQFPELRMGIVYVIDVLFISEENDATEMSCGGECFDEIIVTMKGDVTQFTISDGVFEIVKGETVIVDGFDEIRENNGVFTTTSFTAFNIFDRAIETGCGDVGEHFMRDICTSLFSLRCVEDAGI